ncbi:MAG: GNAT family N-acetyltransferase [Roseobacter sp.]|jgi:hypothetical protein|nr:GNAT family N-acetyltransferase [Roseobacter sp.]
MAQAAPEYFGSPAQIAVLERGHALFELLQGNSKVSCHGRVVGLVTLEENSLNLLARFALLQGSTHIALVRDYQIKDVLENAATASLNPVNYARWEITTDTLYRTEAALAPLSLPEGVTLQTLTPDTPDVLIRSFADNALACGVLPAWRSAHTGQALRSRTLVAVHGGSEVVASAYAAAYITGDSDRARQECFWGMLTTHPDWRGTGLSTLLGGSLLLQMRDEFGFSQFYTGVEPGNAPSEAVCSRLGLRTNGNRIVTLADATRLPGGRMTK